MFKILGMYNFALEAELLPAKEQAISMLHIALVVLRYVAQWTKKVIIQTEACIFLTPFFSAVYNQERLILQTIYVLNKEMWA